MNLMKLLLPNSADVSLKVDAEGLCSHTGRHNGENGDAVLIEPIDCYPGNGTNGTLCDGLNWDGVCWLEFCVSFERTMLICCVACCCI